MDEITVFKLEDKTAFDIRYLFDTSSMTYNHWLQFTMAINFNFNTTANIDMSVNQSLRQLV